MKSKTLVYGTMLLAATAFASCDNNSIEELNFSVSVENGATTVKAGEPVTFLFSGDPDYLIFYSGEFGKKYANRNRYQAEVQDLKLGYNLTLQYARKNYRNGLRVLVSEDFNGSYDEESINAATWTNLDGQLKVPVITSTDEDYQNGSVENVTVDISAYKDKPFYLALEYNMAPLTSEEIANSWRHPDVTFSPKLSYTLDGKTVEKTSPKNDFGFGFLVIEGNKTDPKYPLTTNSDDSNVKIQGRNGINGTHVWAVSSAINASKVSADEGESIKSLSAALTSYTHTYTEPGEYTATFIARNANAWNMAEAIREITITVVEEEATTTETNN